MNDISEKETRDFRFAELDAAIKLEDAAATVTAALKAPVSESTRQGLEKARPRKHRSNSGHSDQAALAHAKQIAREAAETIRKRFGNKLNRTAFIQVSQEFRSSLIPRRKPGRHPHADITAAIEMLAAGKSWTEIFDAIIPGHRMMSRWRRKAVESRLREGVRTRKKRHETDNVTALGELPIPSSRGAVGTGQISQNVEVSLNGWLQPNALLVARSGERIKL